MKPKKTPKGASAAHPDLLDQLSADDALAVLHLLARDKTLAAQIRDVAEAYLEGGAPHQPEDAEAVAEDLRSELDALDVVEVWERAGETRHGYVETSEVADEMIRHVLEPHLAEMARYARLGMTAEATYLCMGLLQGLYAFEHESRSEFKNWASELPFAFAEEVLSQWRDGVNAPEKVRHMKELIREKLFLWQTALLGAWPN